MRAELKCISRPGGSIVNVSSTSGLRGLPKSGAYASSKFGVIGLTESAAAEYGKKGVRINALLPYDDQSLLKVSVLLTKSFDLVGRSTRPYSEMARPKVCLTRTFSAEEH